MTAIPIDALAGVCSATMTLHKTPEGRYEASVAAHPEAGTAIERDERSAVFSMQQKLIDYAQKKARRS